MGPTVDLAWAATLIITVPEDLIEPVVQLAWQSYHYLARESPIAKNCAFRQQVLGSPLRTEVHPTP